MLRKERQFLRKPALWLSALLTLGASAFAGAQAGVLSGYTDIHDFASANEGSNAIGAMVSDGSGNLYGCCNGGGQYSPGGTLFKITSTGTFSIIHQFQNHVEGFQPAWEAYDAGTDTLWVVTENGGNPSISGVSGALVAFPNISTAGDSNYFIAHWFNQATTDGWQPWLMCLDPSTHNVYGSCINGGANQTGMIYCYSPGSSTPTVGTGTYTDVYDFSATTSDPNTGANDNTEGAYPQSVTVDGSGNLWGQCNQGGANGAGTVFEIVNPLAGPSVYVIHSYPLNGYPTDGSSPNSVNQIVDSSGNVWGLCSNGGTGNGGIIWEVPAGGSYTVFASVAPAGGAYPAIGQIAMDANGNIFGESQLGWGGNTSSRQGSGSLWEVSTSTGAFSFLHTFNLTLPSGTQDGGYPSNGVCVYNGMVYGDVFGGGGLNGNGLIFSQSIPVPVTLSTSRTPAALAGGVGVTFTTTVTTPSGFQGGAITLSSPNGDIQVNAPGDSPASSDSITLPAGAGSATFTISAPNDVISATPVVLTVSGGAIVSNTETVTVEPFVQSLVMSAAGTNSGKTLSGYAYVYEAPTTTQTLNVSTTLSGAVLTSGPVTVAAGQPFSSRISFQMPNVNTTQNGTVTVKGQTNISSASANAAIYAPYLTSMAFNAPTTVVAGATATLTATLSGPVATQQTFTVTSGNANLAPNFTVTVPAGSATGTGSVTTTNFNSLSTTADTFSATFGTVPAGVAGTSTHSAVLDVTPYQISAITFPGVTNTGSNASGTITFTTATKSAFTLNLTSSNTSLVPNCSVMIPMGVTSAPISVPTTFTWGTTTPTITISGSIDGTLTRSGTMKLAEDFITGITVTDQNNVTGATASISELDTVGLNVTLNYAPASQQSVTLNSSNTKEYAAVTVTIPANSATGSQSVTPTFNALTVAEVAKLSSGTGSVSITVNPEILSISLSPSTVGASASSTVATVTLFEPYTGSATGTASSNSSIAQCPGTPIVLNNGTKTVQFTVTTSARTTPAVVGITIKALGYTKSANLTFNPSLP